MHAEIIDHTKNWVSSIVVGLNLCPFAERVFNENRIRYSVTDASTPSAVLKTLIDELNTLIEHPRETTETSFLIHPNALHNFYEFNDFTGEVENLLSRMKLEGVIQIVGFHPRYQFAGTESDAVENYTNRSPYPMLHLLREVSITEVSQNPNELLDRNSKTPRPSQSPSPIEITQNATKQSHLQTQPTLL
jgi:uncharacterized protein